MTAWEAHWAVEHYPYNFVIVSDRSFIDPRDPSFDVHACTYPQLQAVAKTLGLPPAGKADALRTAILLRLAQPTTVVPTEE